MITNYIDSVIKEFWSNPESIITPNTKTKLLFDTVHFKRKKSKTKRRCFVKDCNCFTIKNSHSISKGLFLEKISENSSVLTPFFDYSTGKLSVKEISINEASTFPGFCEEHEKLFHDFESPGKFDKDKHYNLQLFRNICREFYVQVSQKESIEYIRDEYFTKRNEGFLFKYRSHPFGKLIMKNGISLASFNYSGRDNIESLIKYQLDKSHLYTEEMRLFYEKGQMLIDNNDDFFTFCLEFEEQIPVCLSGRANIIIKEEKEEKRICLFINVLPLDSNTIIFASTLNENERYLQYYFHSVLNDEISFINLVETWMVRGTDHWFIKPSVWWALDKEIQESILSDIHDLKYNIGTPYDKTIFKDLKKNCG